MCDTHTFNQLSCTEKWNRNTIMSTLDTLTSSSSSILIKRVFFVPLARTWDLMVFALQKETEQHWFLHFVSFPRRRITYLTRLRAGCQWYCVSCQGNASRRVSISIAKWNLEISVTENPMLFSRNCFYLYIYTLSSRRHLVIIIAIHDLIHYY